MKKLVAGLLIAAMCLSLWACGGGEAAEKYEKYKTLIDALEAKDYEGAVAEIYAMYQAEQNGDNQGDNQGGNQGDEEESSTANPYFEKWESVVVSEWVPSNYEVENNGAESFTVNADGTCVIGGETYNWMMPTEDYRIEEDNCSIDVMDGMEIPYKLSFNYNKDYKRYTVSLSVYNAEKNTYDYASGSFYRLADYEVIELTVDNWDDYFEFYEKTGVNKNAFGEVTSFYVYDYYVVKPEHYNKVNTQLSSVAYEYEYTSLRRECTVNLTNQTYELGEETYRSDEKNTSMGTMSERSIDDENRAYGFDYTSFSIDEFEEPDVAYLKEDFAMLRMAGKMYVNINE